MLRPSGGEKGGLNIRPVYEIAEMDGEAFISIPFIEGQSLDKKSRAGLNSLDSEKDGRVPLGHSVDLRFGEPVLLELLEIGQQPIGMNRVQHLSQVA